MFDLKQSDLHRSDKKGAERGISIVELLIVVMMVSIVVAFAVMRIGAAQRAMRLTNSSREFTAWLEKARLDSLRRHPMSTGEMASVTITSTSSYSIIIDQNGDGTLDPARTVSIPGTHGATFAGITVPTTIRYNWRGRPVDASGNLLSLSFSLQDAGGNVNPINLTSTGDATMGPNVNAASVSVNTGISSTSNINSKAIQ
ncbi:MAG: hypothetical protein QOJ64_2598 [Acidobacteriota bacterium]|jgi:Tfp pilus assembly protein FimT|nr:hypothetical protein [Acidobacteriota bacterium]